MISIYQIFMSTGGALTLVGIFLTWNLSRKIEGFFLGHKKLSWCILLGGILTSLGFIVTMLEVHEGIISIAILLGSILIAYSLSESELVKPTWTMLLQIVLIVLSTIFVENKEFYMVELVSSFSLILLINAIVGYVRTPENYKNLAKIASWMFVGFIWLNNLQPTRAIAPVIYVLSVVTWSYTLVRLHYVAVARFSNLKEGFPYRDE